MDTYPVVDNMLNKEREQYLEQHISIRIDQHIMMGVRKAKQKRRTIKRRLGAGIAAMLILFSFVFSVRLNPNVASALSSIPGMNKLIQLIENDRGLSSALQHDFIQPVGLTDVHNDISVTIDGIIVDEGRMNVFYTIKSPESFEPVDLRNLKITDMNGISLSAMISSSTSDHIEILKKHHIIHNHYDINLTEGHLFPEKVILEANTTVGDDWRFEIPIDHERFAGLKEVIDVQEMVNVQGQQFEIKQVTIHPTRIAIDVRIDPNNDMQIFAFTDLKLVNDKNEDLTSYMSTNLDENHKIIYFQINYFDKPEKLYLRGQRIMALDKNLLEFKFNLSDQKVIQAPTDQVQLNSISRHSKDWLLSFTISDIESSDNIGYNIFGLSFTDGSGQEYDQSETGGIRSEWSTNISTQRMYVRIPATQSYVDPLTFSITDYPSFIEQPFEIRIK